MIVPIMTYERSSLVNTEKYIGLDVHQATISPPYPSAAIVLCLGAGKRKDYQ